MKFWVEWFIRVGKKKETLNQTRLKPFHHHFGQQNMDSWNQHQYTL